MGWDMAGNSALPSSPSQQLHHVFHSALNCVTLNNAFKPLISVTSASETNTLVSHSLTRSLSSHTDVPLSGFKRNIKPVFAQFLYKDPCQASFFLLRSATEAPWLPDVIGRQPLLSWGFPPTLEFGSLFHSSFMGPSPDAPQLRVCPMLMPDRG